MSVLIEPAAAACAVLRIPLHCHRYPAAELLLKAPITFDSVRSVGLTLPGVVESTMYGSPALKMQGNLLACVPVNKSAETNCAAFRIDFDLRAALIKDHPEIYYVTEHYAPHPMILARLSRMGSKELREILGLSWSFVSSKKPARSRLTHARGVGRGAQDSRREGSVTEKPGRRRPR